MNNRFLRRHVCGLSSTAWSNLTHEEQNDRLEAALNRRETEGKRRYLTLEEEVEWGSAGIPGSIAHMAVAAIGIPMGDPAFQVATDAIDRAAAAQSDHKGHSYYQCIGHLAQNCNDAMPTDLMAWLPGDWRQFNPNKRIHDRPNSAAKPSHNTHTQMVHAIVARRMTTAKATANL